MKNVGVLSKFVFVLVAAFAFVYSTTGCGPGNVIAKPKTVGEVDDQQATCKVAKDPLNPLIVEWPGTAKVSLDTASQRGVVVVSYAGCVLKVLTRCEAKGEYGYTGVTAARDKIDISSEDELYARLPLGVASLKGELSQGSALRLDYIAIGQRIAPEAPKEFAGDCSGATHYVRAITIGAYSLDAFAKAKAGASVEVGNAGGGGERRESDRRLRGSGDVQACETAKPASLQEASDAGCGAPLLLDLAPLDRDNKGDFVASEFGANLGALDVETSDATVKVDLEKIGFRDIDPDYLELLDKANQASENSKIRPQDKANMWAQVANYQGNNPKKGEAEEYRKKWQTRADDLEKLKQQYLADDAKLKKIAKLDDRIVPAEKKAIYDRQFHEVYDPLQEQLSLVLGSTPSSDSSSSSGSSSSSSSSSDLATIRFGVEAGVDFQTVSQTLKSGETELCTSCYDPGGAGFGGALEIALPNIPSENIGLAALVRFGTGGNVTYISAGGGFVFNFIDTSGALDLGIYASYVNLLSVTGQEDGETNSSAQGLNFEPLSGQNGLDLRAVFRYGIPLGPVTLALGLGLDYMLFFPIDLPKSRLGCAGTASESGNVCANDGTISASGGGIGLFAGAGLQLSL